METPEIATADMEERTEASSTQRFEDYELDVARWELRREGRPVPIGPKPMSLLVYLIRNRDRLVPKDELLEQVWPRVFVSEAALFAAVRDLRRALGDDGKNQKMILTRRGFGFRFVAPLLDSASPCLRG